MLGDKGTPTPCRRLIRAINCNTELPSLRAYRRHESPDFSEDIFALDLGPLADGNPQVPSVYRDPEHLLAADSAEKLAVNFSLRSSVPRR